MSSLRTNNRGDTIIEVMLVVAILGLTFAGAYSIAYASTSKNRNAQEHAEALQYMTSQIEILRNSPEEVIEKTTTGINAEFCFSNTGVLVKPFDPAICNVGTDSRYNVRVRYLRPPSDPGIYRLQVTWQGNGDLGMQSEKIVYKQHQL